MKKYLLGFGILSIFVLYSSISYITKPYRNTDTILGRISNIFNENNSLNLICVNFPKTEVNILWEYEFSSRKIVKNGNKMSSIGNKYGTNKFIIKVGNIFEESLLHYKSNNWHSYDYEIKISKVNSNLYRINFSAKGPNSINEIIEVVLN